MTTILTNNNSSNIKNNIVCVKNLSNRTTAEDLKSFVVGANVGNIINVELKTCNDENKNDDGNHNNNVSLSNMLGIVTFESSEDAGACIENLNGSIFFERQLQLMPFRNVKKEVKQNIDDAINENTNTMLATGVVVGVDHSSRSSNEQKTNDDDADIGITTTTTNVINTTTKNSVNEQLQTNGKNANTMTKKSNNKDMKSVFVNNLPWSVTDVEFNDFLKTNVTGRIGNVIESATVIYGSDHRSRGYAIIKCVNLKGSVKLIQLLNGFNYNGRMLEVRYDVGKKDQSRKFKPKRRDNRHYHHQQHHHYNPHHHHNNSIFKNHHQNPFQQSQFPPHIQAQMHQQHQQQHGQTTLNMHQPFMYTHANNQMQNHHQMANGMIPMANPMTHHQMAQQMAHHHHMQQQQQQQQQQQRQQQAQKTTKPKVYVKDSVCFVTNLPWTCTWMELKDSFVQYNPEFANIQLDHDGRSKGCGTVRFKDAETTKRAIKEMNGTRINGRQIKVRLDNGVMNNTGSMVYHNNNHMFPMNVPIVPMQQQQQPPPVSYIPQQQQMLHQQQFHQPLPYKQQQPPPQSQQ